MGVGVNSDIVARQFRIPNRKNYGQMKAKSLRSQSMDHAQQLAIWSANLVLLSSTSEKISAQLKVFSGFFVSSETLELPWWVRPECFRK